VAQSEVHLVGTETFQEKLTRAHATLREKILSCMKTQMFAVAEYIRNNKLSGQVLNRRSGDLSRATTGQIVEAGEQQVIGVVGTFGIPYAGVHEFGWSGEKTISQVFGRPVVPHAVEFHYPERSFIRIGVDDRYDSVLDAFRGVADAFGKGEV
jgi:phage gpG-like protein